MAAPSSGSLNQGGGSGKRIDSIDDMFLRLGINDDELDYLVFEEEEDAPKEGIKWNGAGSSSYIEFLHYPNFCTTHAGGLESGEGDTVSTSRREFIHGTIFCLGD
jgi:hypothetical protein